MKDREEALEWWGNLTGIQKMANMRRCPVLDGRTWQNLTGREVEIIWRKWRFN